ncbi:histidinol-phosphate transaminase [Marasmius tenuissimus]|nr:histidinol-phosphate transaminase [Marasmius tenuissimus]
MPILGLPSNLPPSKPSHFDIERVIRSNILALHPYRCARDDYKEGILLDANENALGHSISTSSDEVFSQELKPSLDLDLHRYPDPSHDPIKDRIKNLRSISGIDHIFLGVGSDEVIDLLMRVCVTPGGQEKILITPPTYGMYSVCAQVNDVGVVKVPLELSGDKGEGGANGRFSVQVDAVKEVIDSDPGIKLIFLCSPGNPTGTLIPLESIRALLEYENFKGIVVVDEAYIDFSAEGSSAVALVKEYANLCVMQTLSKSFGLAAIRLGVAIAQPPLIQVLTNTKAPYNISTPAAYFALSALSPTSLATMRAKVDKLVKSRDELLQALSTLAHLGVGSAIGDNDANFLMIPILSKTEPKRPDNVRAQKVYKTLAKHRGIVVRFRGNEPGCEACLRITVGSEEENEAVIRELGKLLQEI